VTLFARIFHHGLLRISRRAMVMIMLATYIFGGAMHGLCGLDVTNSSGASLVSLAEKGVNHSDKGVVAEQHCHGCFSVSIPAPIVAGAFTEIATRHVVRHDVARRGLPPGIDPPPPKYLI
jgi:hypothetical protein